MGSARVSVLVLALLALSCAKKAQVSKAPVPVSDGATEAHFADDLEAKCRLGDLGSCLVFAGLLRGGIGHPVDAEEADRIVASTTPNAIAQCLEARRADSCTFAGGMLMLSATKSSGERKTSCVESSIRLLDRGCELSSVASCELLGKLFGGELRDNPVATDLDRSKTAYARACALGSKESCTPAGHFEVVF